MQQVTAHEFTGTLLPNSHTTSLFKIWPISLDLLMIVLDVIFLKPLCMLQGIPCEPQNFVLLFLDRHQFLPVTSNYIPWNIIFAYGIWHLWLSCKKRIFNPPSDARNQMLHRTLHLSSEYSLLIHPCKSSIPKCILNISWQPPVDPFVTLNINGSTLGNPGYAGGGGVIRDSQGR